MTRCRPSTTCTNRLVLSLLQEVRVTLRRPAHVTAEQVRQAGVHQHTKATATAGSSGRAAGQHAVHVCLCMHAAWYAASAHLRQSARSQVFEHLPVPLRRVVVPQLPALCKIICAAHAAAHGATPCRALLPGCAAAAAGGWAGRRRRSAARQQCQRQALGFRDVSLQLQPQPPHSIGSIQPAQNLGPSPGQGAAASGGGAPGRGGAALLAASHHVWAKQIRLRPCRAACKPT